jgi:hypothetical protein
MHFHTEILTQECYKGNLWYSSAATTASFIFIFVNRYNNQLLSLLCDNSFFYQIELVSYWITECGVSPSVWFSFLLGFYQYLIVCNTVSINSNLSRLKRIGFAVCSSAYLTLFDPHTFHGWEQLFCLLKMLWECANRSPFSSCAKLVLG